LEAGEEVRVGGRDAGFPGLTEEVVAEHELTEPRRREAFLALIDLQDHDVPVAESRTLIAERFGIRVTDVLSIEREGLDNDWPPLDA
jgi:hypothetical protein